MLPSVHFKLGAKLLQAPVLGGVRRRPVAPEDGGCEHRGRGRVESITRNAALGAFQIGSKTAPSPRPRGRSPQASRPRGRGLRASRAWACWKHHQSPPRTGAASIAGVGVLKASPVAPKDGGCEHRGRGRVESITSRPRGRGLRASRAWACWKHHQSPPRTGAASEMHACCPFWLTPLFSC